MWNEFKAFLMRGNVLDLAVAVVIGAAFGAIVKSLVDDLIMPLVGLLTGGINFADLFVALDGNSYATLDAAREAGAATINYGLFIAAIVNFVIVAFAIFMLVRAANRFKKQEEKAPAAPPAPSSEEVLLTEIRDILKAQS